MHLPCQIYYQYAGRIVRLDCPLIPYYTVLEILPAILGVTNAQKRVKQQPESRFISIGIPNMVTNWRQNAWQPNYRHRRTQPFLRVLVLLPTMIAGSALSPRFSYG